ncbi:unnamed protein product [Timema podura]|uniref:Uncharacterized protein n=1 Tax=Timema podura TaxID=61482 RepID=A0ABN7PH49_TIMPD|nr:unnamed protein product [Timema podura]
MEARLLQASRSKHRCQRILKISGDALRWLALPYCPLSWWAVVENGKETSMTYENDILTSKTVNGVPQSLTYS